MEGGSVRRLWQQSCFYSSYYIAVFIWLYFELQLKSYTVLQLLRPGQR